MLFKQPILVATALTTLAVATPAVMRRTEPASSCSTGPVNCCNSSGTAKDGNIAKELALLGIVVPDINALIGVSCSPITVIGAGGASCSSQTLCCEDNKYNGIVALGCIPVDISL
ncbi:hypothetical protein PC9H_001563 [Pleurotus ostreatus]|uniref:Hydrophobin n=1 Tax=Pleurotus ostreatus TaxID=5322 RepID=A0A8H7DWB4_PLEOS|nr:uncharacterized protein PC9H_001563 [Pleurotus ostreatus]KAF7441214.1 hypothetical protein PC9H_001563 [Pleurotus ostreatus]KAJ8699276.1 hypothetical protein PTI98_002407 [Pleurotus ostreatus]